MKSLNPTGFVVRQLERHEQSEDLEPGTEGHQGRKPRVPSNGQNLGNKDPAPWVTSLPLAYLWSCGLDPDLSHHRSHSSGPPLTFPPLAFCYSCGIDPLKGEMNKGLQNSP